MAYNRGAVRTRLRVLLLRLSFGGDLSGGAQGALRVYVSHFAGSMLELVGRVNVNLRDAFLQESFSGSTTPKWMFTAHICQMCVLE